MSRAQEYLERYKRARTRIKVLAAELVRLELDRQGISKAGDVPTRAGKSDNTGGLASMIVDKQREIEALQYEAVADRQEVVKTISRLDDVRSIELLNLRYIELMKWEDVSVTMGYDLRYTYKLHDIALEQVEEVLNAF